MTAVRGNGTIHNDSHTAARHKRAVASSGEKLVSAAGSVSSAADIAACARGNTFI